MRVVGYFPKIRCMYMQTQTPHTYSKNLKHTCYKSPFFVSQVKPKKIFYRGICIIYIIYNIYNTYAPIKYFLGFDLTDKKGRLVTSMFQIFRICMRSLCLHVHATNFWKISNHSHLYNMYIV